MGNMERCQKTEFKRKAKQGLYYCGSMWTKEKNPLNTIKKLILKIKNVEDYKIEKEYRVLTNDSANLRFKKTDGTYSYLSIIDPRTVIFRMGYFYIIFTTFALLDNQSNIVLYIQKDAKNQKEIEIDPELFIEELPNGSGIDYNWEYIEHKNGKVTFKNWFHAMNEHGYYDGIMPFKFTVFYDHIKNQFDFNRIVCNETTRKSFFGLKEYLEDTIYACIVGNIDPDKHLKSLKED